MNARWESGWDARRRPPTLMARASALPSPPAFNLLPATTFMPTICLPATPVLNGVIPNPSYLTLDTVLDFACRYTDMDAEADIVASEIRDVTAVGGTILGLWDGETAGLTDAQGVLRYRASLRQLAQTPLLQQLITGDELQQAGMDVIERMFAATTPTCVEEDAEDEDDEDEDEEAFAREELLAPIVELLAASRSEDA